MKSALVISFSDLANDPRVQRQLDALSKSYKVHAAGGSDPRVPNVAYLPLPIVRRSLLERVYDAGRLKLGLYDACYWSSPTVRHCLARLQGVAVDLIIANELNTLPIALRLKGKSKVIFDAHEYAPRELEDRFLWRFFLEDYIDYLCRTYLTKADAKITVCEGIADEYRKVYGVSPLVLTNAPPYYEAARSETRPDIIRMIHHGGAIPSRKIENMISLMDDLDDRFALDMILVPGSATYIEKLKFKARHNPRIRFLAPLPMRELVRFSSSYDVGLFLLEPTNFNYRYSLPNKLFEFIQARLAVAIGPSPEMAKIVQRYDCGIVADDFSPKTLARSLSALDATKIDYYKNQSDKVAKLLSAEQNEKKLLGLAEQLLH